MLMMLRSSVSESDDGVPVVERKKNWSEGISRVRRSAREKTIEYYFKEWSL